MEEQKQSVAASLLAVCRASVAIRDAFLQAVAIEVINSSSDSECLQTHHMRPSYLRVEWTVFDEPLD